MDLKEILRQTALRWWQEKSRVMVEFAGQNITVPPPYLGHVVKLDEDAITFKDVDSTKIKPAVDFAGAEVRLHQYDPAYSKAAFTALWENGLQCVLTEMLGDSPK
jgi:hypothetical protein